jgi:hypothetical protein
MFWSFPVGKKKVLYILSRTKMCESLKKDHCSKTYISKFDKYIPVYDLSISELFHTNLSCIFHKHVPCGDDKRVIAFAKFDSHL